MDKLIVTLGIVWILILMFTAWHTAYGQAATREDLYSGIDCDILGDMVLEIECMQYQTEQIKKSLGTYQNNTNTTGTAQGQPPSVLESLQGGGSPLIISTPSPYVPHPDQSHDPLEEREENEDEDNEDNDDEEE